MRHRESIYAEIEKERAYQSSRFSPTVDDEKNGFNDWVTYITYYATRWFPGGFSPYSSETHPKFRAAMVKVATLAVAAIESYDRKHKENA